jgi:predicted Na+-dependent transporter
VNFESVVFVLQVHFAQLCCPLHNCSAAAVAACPSSVCPAWLQQLGGNVSLALLLTVSSNILGIFTMPFILPHILAAAPIMCTAAAGAGGSATTAAETMLEPLPLLLQLMQTILLPTLLGAAVRGFVPGGWHNSIRCGHAACSSCVAWAWLMAQCWSQKKVALAGIAAFKLQSMSLTLQRHH